MEASRDLFTGREGAGQRPLARHVAPLPVRRPSPLPNRTGATRAAGVTRTGGAGGQRLRRLGTRPGSAAPPSAYARAGARRGRRDPGRPRADLRRRRRADGAGHRAHGRHGAERPRARGAVVAGRAGVRPAGRAAPAGGAARCSPTRAARSRRAGRPGAGALGRADAAAPSGRGPTRRYCRRQRAGLRRRDRPAPALLRRPPSRARARPRSTPTSAASSSTPAGRCSCWPGRGRARRRPSSRRSSTAWSAAGSRPSRCSC